MGWSLSAVHHFFIMNITRWDKDSKLNHQNSRSDTDMADAS